MFDVLLLLIIHFIVAVMYCGFKGGLLEQAMTMTMGAEAIIAIFSPPIGIPLFIRAFMSPAKAI